MPGARERFETLDPYRADREWRRYEGTAQRELFRDLRIRFLRRHAAPGRWAVDVGSGPGRFLPSVGPDGSQRIALDLSTEMLLRVEPTTPPSAHLVRGDGIQPPLARDSFANVAVLGNSIGFAGRDSERFLSAAEELVAPGGNLLLEVVAGPGERARYLQRLPPSAVTRLLRSPVAAVYRRAVREGFALEPARRSEPGDFRRFEPGELGARLENRGWKAVEIVAVAPVLGASPLALEAVRSDAKAWSHLIELEELVGRQPERWRAAAAVLLALTRPGRAARTVK
jgi:SAM-dependent methyltransferase